MSKTAELPGIRGSKKNFWRKLKSFGMQIWKKVGTTIPFKTLINHKKSIGQANQFKVFFIYQMLSEAKEKENELAELKLRNLGTRKAKRKGFFREFFNLKNLKEGFSAILKKREGYKRAVILLLVLAFELEIFSLIGKWGSLFLYFRKILDWTILEYSRYTTTLGVIGLLAQYIAVPFLTAKLNFQDYTIAMLGTYNAWKHPLSLNGIICTIDIFNNFRWNHLGDKFHDNGPLR